MIELLVKLSLVDRLAFPDGTMRYHVRQRETGDDVTCERCHKVLEIQAPIVSHTLEDLAQRSGFDLSAHHLEVFGRRPDCQKHP
jgi:Fe2+ or Zn2+ uptake regulation protein